MAIHGDLGTPTFKGWTVKRKLQRKLAKADRDIREKPSTEKFQEQRCFQ